MNRIPFVLLSSIGYLRHERAEYGIEQVSSTDDEVAPEFDEIREIIDASTQQVVSRVVERKQRFAWGPGATETIRRTEEPDADQPRITEYAYHTDEGQASYGKLASVRYPDGGWVRHEYDEYGRKLRDISIWNNAPFTATPAAARVVEYAYGAAAATDHRPRQRTEKILDIIVSRSFFAYETDNDEAVEIHEDAAGATAAYGDSGNPRTVTRHYAPAAGVAAGRVRSVSRPDGTVEEYTYETGVHTPGATPAEGVFTPGPGADLRTTRTRRAAGEPGDIAGRTVRDVTIADPQGRTIRQETWVFTGVAFDRAAWSVYAHDSLGRRIAAHHSDDTQEAWAWAGRHLVRETARTGMVTRHTHDDLGRRLSSTIEGVAEDTTLGFAAQPDRTEATEYDLLDRPLVRARLAGSLRLAVTNAYDALGRLTESIDPAGRVTGYTYGADFRTTTQTAPGGATVTTARRPDGRTARVHGTGMVERTYAYGVEPDGRQWTTVYTGPEGLNSPMWEKSWSDLLGRTVRSERPGYGGTNIVSLVTYDTAGRPVKSETLDGQNQRLAPAQLSEYDAFGELVRQGLDIDGNGQLLEGTSDRIRQSAFALVHRDGHWWKERMSILLTDESGAFTVTNGIVRTQLGGPGCSCDGGVTETIDLFGQSTVRRTYQQASTRVEGTVVEWPDREEDDHSVSRNGLPMLTTTAAGVVTAYTHDALGRAIEARTDSNGGRSIAQLTHYDTLGQVESVEDAAGNKTWFAYDDAGRRSAVTNALDQVTHTAYDPQGRVLATWGATYPVAYEYDVFGRMTAMATTRDPAHESVNLWTLVPAGTTLTAYSLQSTALDLTQWNYDPATGLLLQKLYADNKGPTYTYTEDGKLARRTWARGVTTDYGYTIAGELASVNYSDATPDVSYSYDHLGRMIEAVTVGVSTNAYSYDPATLARAGETRSSIFGQPETLVRLRDDFGRPAGLTLDADYAAGYGYDAAGRFATVASTNTASAVTGQWTYERLPGANLVTGWTTPAGHFWRRSYEANRDLIAGTEGGFGATVEDSYAYTNDAVGRRVARVDSGVTANTFGYNLRSEVISAMMGSEEFGYAYDPIGNRIASTNAVETLSYTANALNQYTGILNGTPVTPTYDDDGNMLSFGNGWTAAWDGENRLAQISNFQFQIAYTYDHQSRRIAKETASGVEVFTYDDWAMIRHTAPSGGKTDYIYGLDLSGTIQGAGTIGGLLGMVRTGDTAPACYGYDANGNVTLMTDGVGAVAARYAYDPFGNTLSSSGPLAAINPFRFSTKYHEAETGLYYYGYRFYDAVRGRFISQDPMHEIGSLTQVGNALIHGITSSGYISLMMFSDVATYGFVRNSPISLMDNLGLYTIVDNPYSVRPLPINALPSVPYPITDDCVCPPGTNIGRRPKAGWDPYDNNVTDKRCTISILRWAPGATGWLFHYFSSVFDACCKDHDACYATCNNPKRDCDNDFAACMSNKCESYNWGWFRNACIGMAAVYHTGVDTFGDMWLAFGQSYSKLQDAACENCCCKTIQ